MTLRILLPIFLLAAGCGRKASAPVARPDTAPAFWIWHRSSALTPAEVQLLSQAGADRLYRQVGEFGWRDGKWSARPTCDGAVILEQTGTIPVIRLDPGPELLLRDDAAASLAKWLRHHFDQQLPASLQIDHDCPARLLGRYAEFIGELRTELKLTTISITALASWIDSPAFGKLAKAADELVPMFYDLTADLLGDIVAGKALPMAGDEASRWIRRWKSCPTAWRAGLPNFERLSLFKADGTLVGHLRQWTPESLASARFLDPILGDSGGAVYRVNQPANLHGTALETDQLLVWRAPDDSALRALIRDSFDAGARGIVWFALPGPGLRASHSAPHLAALARADSPLPGIRISLDSEGRVTIRNDGPGDLVMLPGATVHRLILETDQAGTFTMAGPGDFLETSSEMPPTFSRKLVLTFPRLHVGEEVASAAGLIAHRAGRDLRWSVDDSASAPLP